MTNAAPWARAVAAAAVAGGCLACGGRGADSGASEGTPGASGVSMQGSSGMPMRTGTTDSTALDGAAVSSAMGVALRAPASQVTDLRYENGHLTFKVDGGSVKFSAKGKRDGSGAPFAPEDAQRFLEAVQAAKARQTAM